MGKLIRLNFSSLSKRASRLSKPMLQCFLECLNIEKKSEKTHTIRCQKKSLKVGDKFTPAIWSGLPYRSPQIIFWDDIEVKKTFDITFTPADHFLSIDEATFTPFNGYTETINKLSKNDGLSGNDFYRWFSYNGSSGTIICWDENISYI